MHTSTDNTYRVLQLINHDDQFEYTQTQSPIEPLILNRLDISDPSFIDIVKESIFCDGNGSDFVASCSCGFTEGNNKIGMICPACDTPVTSATQLEDNNLVCKSWISCPRDLPHGWLAPKVYLVLSTWLSYGKGGRSRKNYLDDILDMETEIPYELREIITGKGFTYLYENFDRIMDYFINVHTEISKKSDTPAIRLFIKIYRDRLFCHYIPILPSVISPIIADRAGSNRHKFSDTTADYVIRAAETLSHNEFKSKRRISDRLMNSEKAAFKAFKDIVMYVSEATDKFISVKRAIPRTHLFGGRFHLTFRGVVHPIVGEHYYYEIHWPYKMAVNTLRVHILGVLCREYGLTPEHAQAKHRNALQKTDPDITAIMNKMIEESPYKGIPCLWDRPPSIRDGSVQLKYITKIKEDIEDSAIGITSLDVAWQNADFDGDQLAGIVLIETDMVEAMSNLSPTSFIFDRNSGGVSSEIGVPKDAPYNVE